MKIRQDSVLYFSERDILAQIEHYETEIRIEGGREREREGEREREREREGERGSDPFMQSVTQSVKGQLQRELTLWARGVNDTTALGKDPGTMVVHAHTHSRTHTHTRTHTHDQFQTRFCI